MAIIKYVQTIGIREKLLGMQKRALYIKFGIQAVNLIRKLNE